MSDPNRGGTPPRPGFAAGYPARPEIDALLESFRAGDYRTTRQRAKSLVAESEDQATRSAAQDLLDRLDPSRLTLLLFLLPLGLLALIVAHYLLDWL